MITRRSFVSTLAAPFLSVGRTVGPKHNVLFIGSDDLRSALGCYGHPIVKTPHLDSLAARGLRFNRAYCNFPLCGPSRTSLLSGVRPDTTKIWDNQIAVRDTMPDAVTLPQLFRRQGAHSARFGKMYHMNVPGSVGNNNWDDPEPWDRSISPPGQENRTPGEGRNVTPDFPAGNAFHWISFTGDGKNQADQLAADLTAETITTRKDPFFIGLGFLRPHVPLVAPSRFFDLYPLSQMNPVVNPEGDLDDIPKASELMITRRGNDMGMNDRDKREVLRAYYASISYMDSLVGQAVSALEKAKKLDNTVIVFWSDHGYHLGEHFRWQKRSLFEESMRVPLIVSSPGQRARGTSTNALVELVDLYPTVADLCRLPAPAHLEGQSFAPLLDNPNRRWKSAAFCQVHLKPDIAGRAIRTERYRYIRWTGPHPDEELYDQQADPRENTNLAHRPGNEKVLVEMRAKLDAGWKAARASV